jgi:hypothetical protein
MFKIFRGVSRELLCGSVIDALHVGSNRPSRGRTSETFPTEYARRLLVIAQIRNNIAAPRVAAERVSGEICAFSNSTDAWHWLNHEHFVE